MIFGYGNSRTRTPPAASGSNKVNPVTMGKLRERMLSQRPLRTCALIGACIVMLSASMRLAAIEEAVLEAGDLLGEGWHAERVRIRLSQPGNTPMGVEVLIGRLSLRQPAIVLQSIRLTCPALQLTWRLAQCKKARISLPGLPLPQKFIDASFRHDFSNGETAITVPRLALPGGSLSARASGGRDGWDAGIRIERAAVNELLGLAGNWVDLPGLPVLQGEIRADIEMTGDPELESLAADLEIRGLSGANEPGTLAGENLGAHFSVDARRREDLWTADIRVSQDGGQAYLHPVYLDLDEHPGVAEARLEQTTARQWQLGFTLGQAGIGEARGAASFKHGGWTSPEWFELSVDEARLPTAYAVYLQPFLVGTAADSLETAGQVEGSLRVEGGRIRSVRLVGRDLHLDDTRGRFAVYGVEGVLDWQPGVENTWQVGWQGGFVYRVGFGGASTSLSSLDTDLALQGPLQIPVLDGHLRISEFQVRNLGQPELQLDFDAEVDAIGLRALTRALRWPPFAGTLSGSIPRVRFEREMLTVDGVLYANVFGGRVEVENLRLANPLGVLPEFQADASLRGLDLAALTSTFRFGHIEGKLHGDVSDLRMLGFSPVRFDARIYTPPGDRSRHRISQQAIQNISEIGGTGAAGAVSRSMLRFFESFAYDVIGWSCVLENEVCRMDGAAPAPGGGFYLVKGKGLPQVNVVGHKRRVSWPRLVQKLREISKGSRPEIR